MCTTTHGSDMHMHVFVFSRSLARSRSSFSLSFSLSAAAHGVKASPTAHISIARNSPRSHRRGRKSPLTPPEMTLDELSHAKEQESEDRGGDGGLQRGESDRGGEKGVMTQHVTSPQPPPASCPPEHLSGLNGPSVTQGGSAVWIESGGAGGSADSCGFAGSGSRVLGARVGVRSDKGGYSRNKPQARTVTDSCAERTATVVGTGQGLVASGTPKAPEDRIAWYKRLCSGSHHRTQMQGVSAP